MNRTSLKVGVIGFGVTGNISSGTGRYIYEVCRQLDDLWPETEFFLYVQNADDVPQISSRWTIRSEPVPLFRKMKYNLWLKFRAGSLARKDNLNVLWSATGLLPYLTRSMCRCLTVLDLNLLIAPETMPRYTRWAHRLFLKSDILHADALLAISQGTANRLRAHYGVSVEAVAPCAPKDIFSPRPPEQVSAVKLAYDLSERYVLAVGTLEPRKNIVNLIKAFDLLDRSGDRNGYQLVLVGLRGWKDDEINGLIANFEAKWLKRLGFVHDEDLASVYTGAALVAVPSLYEGFGIPVVEARACGTRVAVSNTAELREYCGSEAVIIDGFSPVAIADALAPALQIAHEKRDSGGGIPTWRDAGLATKRALLTLAIRDRGPLGPVDEAPSP